MVLVHGLDASDESATEIGVTDQEIQMAIDFLSGIDLSDIRKGTRG